MKAGRFFGVTILWVMLCSISFGSSGWIAGKVGNALAFDGVNDYVEVTGYKGILGTQSRTCCAWIKTTSTQQGIILSWGAEQNGQKWIFRVESNGTLAVGVWGGYVYTTATVNNGQWHYVATVLNDDGSPSVNEIQLYIDGVLQGTTASNAQSIGTIASQNVMIGAFKSAGVTGSYFNGLLDEVCIYNRALNASEIVQANPIVANGLVTHWSMDETQGKVAHDSVSSYDGTLTNFYSGGSGTTADPYQIANKADLLALAATTTDYNKYFILTADIDMSGQIFTKAIIAPDTSSTGSLQGTPFTGTFDGIGHRITNFTINGGGNGILGLFGHIDSGGQIKRLGLETCTVSGYQGVGILVGYLYGGSVSNCYSTGSTVSGSFAGGLVGYCASGTISQCYSTSSVAGTSNIGGLVGYNNFGGSVSSSFWDTQTSGRMTSAGGTGKTTTQMKTQSTFTSAGWDFVNTWFMSSNDYPRLIGLSLTTVPDVVGMTQTVAQTAITAAGLTVGSVTQAFSESVPAGNVISQSPAAGILVNVGSAVNLVVSLGRAVAVPDVVGILQADAQLAITSAELAVGSISQAFSDSVPAGNVISQSPSAGILVNVGSAVNLVVSLGRSIVVPDIVGILQADAQLAITSAELTIGKVKTIYTNSIPAGTVISQSPTAETLVTVGSTVNLVISLGNKGSGTPQDPFQITAKADLLVLAMDVDNYNKCFILTADIDLAGQTFTIAIIAPNTNSSSNFQGTAFAGTFDGNNHKITNFTLNGGSVHYLGLFSYIGSGGQVKNLSLEDCAISGPLSSSYTGIGGLAGYNKGGISNCHLTGSVSGCQDVGGLVGDNWGNISWCYSQGAFSGTAGSSRIGGLVGYNPGSISNCYCSGTVSGPSESYFVGGLVGENYGDISQCYSMGTVSGYQYIGGLAGEHYGGSIRNCYATNTVSSLSNSQYVGGLTGYSGSISSSLVNCYSTGNVSGTSYIGGLIGRNGSCNVSNCYSIGNVNGYSYIGGLIGCNGSGSVSNCYSTGKVSGSLDVGGLMGFPASGSITGCFWDIQTSGQAASAGGVGKTTAQMKILSTFTNAGWDFSLAWIDGDFQDWVLVTEGIEYPKLKWQFHPSYSGGSGIASDPYRIANKNDFWLFMDSWWDWDKHFILTNDIDLSGITWTQALISPDTTSSNYTFDGVAFAGTFDGRGYTIKNLTIQGGSNRFYGLFGQIGAGGQIRNLGLENSVIAGASGSVLLGSLAGENYGSIDHCSSTGTVSGATDSGGVGGLVGENSGNIKDCYAVSTVSGYANVGGLVGDNQGSISSCFATGSIDGFDPIAIGGLVGSNNSGGNISNCYAMSSVSVSGSSISAGGLVGTNSESTINNCYSVSSIRGSSSEAGLVGSNYYATTNNSFWDTQNSGRTSSAGGAGKTTAEMQTLSTFISAGWDFVNGTNDTLSHTWFIREGQEYPRLLWEIQNDQSGLFSQGFVTLSKTRVGRTAFEYELAVTVHNSNAFAMTNVQMKLMDWDAAVQSVLDDSITIDSIPAGATVTSTDTFKIVVDRIQPINSSRLIWELTYYVPGGQVQQAMMTMPLSMIDTIPGDITGDGHVNLDDFAILSAQWNTATGSSSADIAFPKDGVVGIEDLLYLAENWMN